MVKIIESGYSKQAIMMIYSGINYDSIRDVFDFAWNPGVNFGVIMMKAAVMNDISGFGKYALSKYLTWDEWENSNWTENYKNSFYT